MNFKFEDLLSFYCDVKFVTSIALSKNFNLSLRRIFPVHYFQFLFFSGGKEENIGR